MSFWDLFNQVFSTETKSIEIACGYVTDKNPKEYYFFGMLSYDLDKLSRPPCQYCLNGERDGNEYEDAAHRVCEVCGSVCIDPTDYRVWQCRDVLPHDVRSIDERMDLYIDQMFDDWFDYEYCNSCNRNKYRFIIRHGMKNGNRITRSIIIECEVAEINKWGLKQNQALHQRHGNAEFHIVGLEHLSDRDFEALKKQLKRYEDAVWEEIEEPAASRWPIALREF